MLNQFEKIILADCSLHTIMMKIEQKFDSKYLCSQLKYVSKQNINI